MGDQPDLISLKYAIEAVAKDITATAKDITAVSAVANKTYNALFVTNGRPAMRSTIDAHTKDISSIKSEVESFRGGQQKLSSDVQMSGERGMAAIGQLARSIEDMSNGYMRLQTKVDAQRSTAAPKSLIRSHPKTAAGTGLATVMVALVYLVTAVVNRAPTPPPAQPPPPHAAPR